MTTKSQRLYYCTADIEFNGAQIVLFSYNTPVVIIDRKRDFIAIYRYNSATTAQHLRKFQKWLYGNAPLKMYQRYRDLLDLAVKKYKKRFAFDGADGYKFYDYSYDMWRQFLGLKSY